MNTLIIFVNSSSSTWSMAHKEVKTDELELPGLSSFLSAAYNNCVERSNVVYVDIVSLPADSKDTILRILNKLHHIFIVERTIRWLVVVGDAKTQDILQNLQHQYGGQLQWMLPFPGDWHILYNYQKVLLKIYGDAGLLQLAKVAGHRSETLKSLAQASHFKRTHHFILQSFEAIYRLFLRLYLHSLETTPEAPPSQIPPSQATPLSANPQVPTSPEVGTLQYIPV